MNPPNSGSEVKPDIQRTASARSRRAFLAMGVAAVAGYGGWSWLRSRPREGDVEWPLRGALQTNERVAEAYFSDRHLAPTFHASQVESPVRTNGDVGLGNDFDQEKWVLDVEDSRNATQWQVTMAQIRELPRVEQITQLNCIEGWTVVVQWAGVRFADFTAKYAPQSRTARYVGMQTPDQEYFVGLDGASALAWSAARSNSATRASMSSISIALAEWSSTLSAALTFVEAGVAGSTMTLRRVETAALVACCSRAIDCENAARRASR